MTEPTRPGAAPPLLEILYRDAALIAVAKPSGLPVHRGWARRGWTVAGALARQLELTRVHPLHRLDQSTSGVLLFGLRPEVARRIQAMFDARQVHKRYLAVVRGLAPARGHLDYPIPRAPGEARVPAQTAWRRLESREIQPRTVSLVEAVPETGRLHQVRRHLKHLNHPVLMDANHGDSRLNRAFRRQHGLDRLALHAYAVRFPHPLSGQRIQIVASVPEDLAAPLERMGFERRLWQQLENWLAEDFVAEIADNERIVEGGEA